MHFFNVDFAEGILRRDIPRFQKQQFAMYYYIVVLKNLAKITGMHLVSFQPPTFNFIGKRDTNPYSFLWVLQNILGTLLLWKVSCELVLKGESYEKCLTNILIIIKRYRKVKSFFKKQTLWGKVYIWEPLIESWHLA